MKPMNEEPKSGPDTPARPGTLHRRLQRFWQSRPFVYRPRIRDYLASHPVRRLRLGGGPGPLDGWLNLDPDPDPDDPRTVWLDPARPFPLPNDSFDSIFGERLLEHLTLEQGRRLARESFRVLKPGGRIRLATPHLRRLMQLYGVGRGAEPEAAAYLDWARSRYVPDAPTSAPGYVINHLVRARGQGFFYDEVTLSDLLRGAGFAEVREMPVGVSLDPAFVQLESAGEAMGEDHHRYETVVVEGTKPGSAVGTGAGSGAGGARERI